MFDIFVSYRSADSRFGAAATYELLANRFGRDRIFLDNQSMEPGAVYPRRLRDALDSMRVLLVLIGPRWLAADRVTGRLLIHRENDWVRREIGRALERPVAVIPVLLEGAQLPSPERLPDDVRPLVHHQVAEVRHRYLGVDIDRLANRLCALLPGLADACLGSKAHLGQLSTGYLSVWSDVEAPPGTMSHTKVVTGGDVVGVPGTTTAVPRQLPATSRHFVDRVAELERLDAALRGSDIGSPRIALLSGMAGVGKSTLAVHWARRCMDDFPDGQLFVDLRGYGAERPLSPLEALSGFLRALGVAHPEELTSLDERAARFRTLLSERRVLVFLDNARSVQQVRPLLPGVGESAVLMTSRHRLSGLVVHQGAEHIPVLPLSQADGVDLLRTTIGQRVTDEPDPTLALVARCAGLPLALCITSERAVARPLDPLSGMVEELEDESARLDALDTEESSAGIRTAFSWSYQGLGERDAAAFRLLGLHPAHSFDIAAMAALIGVSTGAASVSMAVLTGAHLVSEPQSGRYELHDLLHAYARELCVWVDAPRERAEARRRLFDHYLHTAERADRVITPHRFRIPLDGDASAGVHLPDTAQARSWLETEIPNLVALCRLDEPALDARRWQLAYVLRGYFYLSKHLDRWTETQALALAACLRAGDRGAEAVTRNNLGMALVECGRLDDAMDHFGLAQQIFASIGDDHGLNNALANQASVLRRRGDHEEALRSLRRVLMFYRKSGARRNAGITLRSMAGAELAHGHIAAGVCCAEEAVDIALGLGQHLDVAQAFNVLGFARQCTGDLTLAEIALRQALEFGQRCGSDNEQAIAARRLGGLAVETGRSGEAEQWYQMALALYRRMGSTDAEQVSADLAALPGALGPP